MLKGEPDLARMRHPPDARFAFPGRVLASREPARGREPECTRLIMIGTGGRGDAR